MRLSAKFFAMCFMSQYCSFLKVMEVLLLYIKKNFFTLNLSPFMSECIYDSTLQLEFYIPLRISQMNKYSCSVNTKLDMRITHM